MLYYVGIYRIGLDQLVQSPDNQGKKIPQRIQQQQLQLQKQLQQQQL